jgi:N utilization substance protein A
VYIDDETREATVVVPDDQLALAIGKEGLNARLAARLTGWKVDIESESEFARQEADAAYGGGDDEDFSGRCSAILSNGKRCPNASLPGSRYCGVPAHQELALAEPDVPVEETPAEIADDPDVAELAPVARVEEEGRPEAEAASEPESAEAELVETETEAEGLESIEAETATAEVGAEPAAEAQPAEEEQPAA